VACLRRWKKKTVIQQFGTLLTPRSFWQEITSYTCSLIFQNLIKLGCRVDESLEFYEDGFLDTGIQVTNFLFIEEYSAFIA